MIASVYDILRDRCNRLSSVVLLGSKETDDIFHDCILLVSQDPTDRTIDELMIYFEYRFKMILFQNNQDLKQEYADNKTIAKSKKNI